MDWYLRSVGGRDSSGREHDEAVALALSQGLPLTVCVLPHIQAQQQVLARLERGVVLVGGRDDPQLGGCASGIEDQPRPTRSKHRLRECR